MVEPAARTVWEETEQRDKNWARIDEHDPESLTWWNPWQEQHQTQLRVTEQPEKD